MASQQELQVQQKREVEKRQESTVPTRAFVPIVDIFETEQALSVILEMPGVEKENVDISVENDTLTIQGRIDYSKYEGLQPVYTEYNVGHYVRTIEISKQDRTRADQRRAEGWSDDTGPAESGESKAAQDQGQLTSRNHILWPASSERHEQAVPTWTPGRAAEHTPWHSRCAL